MKYEEITNLLVSTSNKQCVKNIDKQSCYTIKNILTADKGLNKMTHDEKIFLIFILILLFFTLFSFSLAF